MNRIELIDLLKSDFSLGIGVEVGTFKGEYSKEILQRWDGQLFMIDVWDELGDEYADSSNHKNFEGGVYSECMKNIRGFEDRAIMIRAKSHIASKFFGDNSLDFVYIDANHSYEFVKEDINLWYPKVKKGGWVMGHDYLKLNWSNPPYTENGIDKHIWLISDNEGQSNYAGVFGVNPAVDEFCKQHNYTPSFTDEWLGTWYFKK
jgi:hypothetical protein